LGQTMIAKHLAKRFGMSIVVLWLTITAVFFAFASIPGDPAQMYAGSDTTPELVQRLRQQFGTDRPVYVRYYLYLRNLLRGDLGDSFFSGRPVLAEVGPRFANTALLALVSIACSTVTGVLLGVVSATSQSRAVEQVVSIITLLGISIPVFWLGLLLILLFSVKLGMLPAGGTGSLAHLLMPSLTLSVYPTAFITRMTRSSVLDVIRQDYVRTARAKGLPERIVVFRHALSNALVPIVTVIGLRFGYLLGGAVVTESIFGWPGLGRLLVAAVGNRDYYLIQGCILVFAASFVLINTLVDLSYFYLNPKVRYH